jgi:uncharacterized protein YecE (DUF72 family)
MSKQAPMIRAGVGGWTFDAWRGVFCPPGLPHARELEFASRKLSTIEINGTFYRTQKPDTFRKWADETPEGFVFSVKAPRYAVNKRVLAEAGPSIQRFTESGLHELGDKLGPILWQFPPTKKFDAKDFAAFLALLPREARGAPLRHAVELRHASFEAAEAIEMAAEAGAAIVFADSDAYPRIDAPAQGFAYARLMRARAEEEKGYPGSEFSGWVERARAWASAGREVFIYFIDGAKLRAPAAACAFLARLDHEPRTHVNR